MTNLRLAHKKGEIEEFIKEHEADPDGNLDKLDAVIKRSPRETGVARMREERKKAIQTEEDAWKAAAKAFDAFRAKQTDKPGHMD